MVKVQVWADLSERAYTAYLSEAQRRGVKVELLVEQTVNSLLEDLEHDIEKGTDHPVVMS